MPINELLVFPCKSYLKLRLDYILICGGGELEAKIMRIIEMYMDLERLVIYRDMLNDPNNKIDKDAVTEVTKDVWVPISHRLFKNDLYDQDMAENTLKKGIKLLEKMGYIAIDDTRGTRYEAARYQICVDNVQAEFDLLKRMGKTAYQKLMVSKIDGIKKSPHQILTPSGYQNLIPSTASRVSNFDTHSNTDSVVDSLVNEITGCDENSSQQPASSFSFEPSDPLETEEEEPLHIASGTTSAITLPVVPETPRPIVTFRRSSAEPAAEVVSQGRPPRPLKLLPSQAPQVVQDSLIPPGGDERESDVPRADGYRKGAGGEAGKVEQATDTPPAPGGKGGSARKKQISPIEVEQYLDLLDRLGRETTYKDSSSGRELYVMPNGYGRTGVARDAVRTLLKNNLREGNEHYVTPAKLTRVYQHMASLPVKNGYHWATQGMSVKSITNNYDQFANELIQEAQRREAQRRQQQQSPPPPPIKDQSTMLANPASRPGRVQQLHSFTCVIVSTKRMTFMENSQKRSLNRIAASLYGLDTNLDQESEEFITGVVNGYNKASFDIANISGRLERTACEMLWVAAADMGDQALTDEQIVQYVRGYQAGYRVRFKAWREQLNHPSRGGSDA